MPAAADLERRCSRAWRPSRRRPLSAVAPLVMMVAAVPRCCAFGFIGAAVNTAQAPSPPTRSVQPTDYAPAASVAWRDATGGSLTSPLPMRPGVQPWPCFPESPHVMMQEIEDSINTMLRTPNTPRRLRIDLQLEGLSGLTDDWSRSVGQGYFPIYEELLARLLHNGYEKVLAIFDTERQANAMCKSLQERGVNVEGLQVEYLTDRKEWISVGYKDLVVFFSPRTEQGDLSVLTEFQRITAVATIRACPVITINPRMWAANPYGLTRLVRPMVLGDFAPCYQLAAHRYKYNNYIAYSVLRRQGQHWQVFVHDSRLPGSGWALLEEREGSSEPSRLDIEARHFDTAFFVNGRGGVSRISKKGSSSSRGEIVGAMPWSAWYSTSSPYSHE